MHREQMREMAARRKTPDALNILNTDLTHAKDGKGVPRAYAHLQDDGKKKLN